MAQVDVVALANQLLGVVSLRTGKRGPEYREARDNARRAVEDLHRLIKSFDFVSS